MHLLQLSINLPFHESVYHEIYLCCLNLGGYPCYRLFPHEPDANPAARSQRVSERAGLPERHQHLRESHPNSRQRPCVPWRGLDETSSVNLLSNTFHSWSEYLTWRICRDYQRIISLSNTEHLAFGTIFCFFCFSGFFINIIWQGCWLSVPVWMQS